MYIRGSEKHVVRQVFVSVIRHFIFVIDSRLLTAGVRILSFEFHTGTGITARNLPIRPGSTASV
jgi:hypothetical protein